MARPVERKQGEILKNLKEYGDTYLTMVEVASILCIAPQAARDLANEKVAGHIPFFYLPTSSSRPQKRVSLRDLNEWIEVRKIGTKRKRSGGARGAVRRV